MAASATRTPESQATLPPGRLAQRKARTRSAILQAATGLFTENGYAATSIQDVATSAGIGVGTLYGYYSSKEDLFGAVLTTRWNDALQNHLASLSPDMPAIEQVVAAVTDLARYIRSDRRLLWAAFAFHEGGGRSETVYTDRLLEDLARVIDRGKAAGQIGDVPALATVRVLHAGAVLSMLGLGAWAGENEDDDDARIAELQQITRQLLRT